LPLRLACSTAWTCKSSPNLGSEGSVEQTRGPMNKNRMIRAYGAGRTGKEPFELCSSDLLLQGASCDGQDRRIAFPRRRGQRVTISQCSAVQLLPRLPRCHCTLSSSDPTACSIRRRSSTRGNASSSTQSVPYWRTKPTDLESVPFTFNGGRSKTAMYEA
jgi:hypothetical protein